VRARNLIVPAVFAAAGLLAALAAAPNKPPARVIDRSAEAGTLETKLDRALADGPALAAGKPFWVGYAIDRLMGEHSTIGSYTEGRRDLSIRDVLAGKAGTAATSGEAIDLYKEAKVALERIDSQNKPEKQVVKELGFFLKYGAEKTPVLGELGMSVLELSFDFEGAPLIWLGKAAEDRSLALIQALYGKGGGAELRESLVAAAGCHGTPALVLPFLEKVLAGDASDEIRKDAAFWIGQQNDLAGLRLLARTARSDRSEEVREGAVFGISQVERPEAVDELIALAKGAEKRDVRKQAVFWLGQMASDKAGRTLEQIALADDDLEVQEQALFALSELPDDQGLDALIKLAKTHRDARIRKKAVFWLGESDDPRALEALVAIIKGK
jgi:hypothetical protein